MDLSLETKLAAGHTLAEEPCARTKTGTTNSAFLCVRKGGNVIKELCG